MSRQLQGALNAYILKAVRTPSGGGTVTIDAMSRWDVDTDTGLVIGSQTTVDASSCITRTNVSPTFT